MGKTIKGNAKAKAKAKCEQAKRKIAAKCKGKCAVVAALLSAVALFGCNQVPSRSQTLTMRECTINVYGAMSNDTNRVTAVDIATQAMSIENSGTETFTPTQTTDVKPDVDVTVGGKATAGKGVLEKAADKFLGDGECEGGKCSE